ncbi:MAG: hypothetical protein JWN26_129 [Candidatus Saccharibacteria bacterium]|nr:hypothetical protein [Candidatus Saccharibacteria bacterium]
MSDDQKENYWEQNPGEPAEQVPTAEVSEEPEPTEEAPVEQESTDPEPVEEEEEPEDDPGSLVHWTASEYIHIEKNGLWYILFALVVLGLITLDVFVLKSYTFSALVIVMAVALIIYTRRPPRTMQYTLSENHGLYIGERLYSFEDFKAFGLLKDGEHHSIMLIPTKRFAPGVSVYFPEESGEEIVDILGVRLPMRPLKLDFLDTVIRRLRL